MKLFHAAILLILLAGCGTVKDVGGGLTTAAPGVSHFGGALGAAGVILDVGSDVFSKDPSENELRDKAASKWKGYGVKATPGLEAYSAEFFVAGTTGGDISKSLEETMNKAKADSKSGRFPYMPLSAYLGAMDRYDRGDWISVDYADEKIRSGGLVLLCNKASQECILSIKGEQVAFPALRESTVALRKMLGNKHVNVGVFTSYEPGLQRKWCRIASPISSGSVSGAATFTDIPRLFLSRELKDANLFDAESPLVLTGHLKSLDFSSYSGKWHMTLDILSSNGKSMSVTETYDFESGIFGQVACDRTELALGPAMEELVKKVIFDPAFPLLLGP